MYKSSNQSINYAPDKRGASLWNSLWQSAVRRNRIFKSHLKTNVSDVCNFVNLDTLAYYTYYIYLLTYLFINDSYVLYNVLKNLK